MLQPRLCYYNMITRACFNVEVSSQLCFIIIRPFWVKLDFKNLSNPDWYNDWLLAISDITNCPRNYLLIEIFNITYDSLHEGVTVPLQSTIECILVEGLLLLSMGAGNDCIVVLPGELPGELGGGSLYKEKYTQRIDDNGDSWMTTFNMPRCCLWYPVSRFK